MTKTIEMHPLWEDCDMCDDVKCNLHQKHTHECNCPTVEYWLEDVGSFPYDIKIPVIVRNWEEDEE